MEFAAAYVRVSDERQDEYSPDSQLNLIRDYAKRNDYIIPKEFIFYDDGVSAKSTKGRDEFNRMLSLAEKKEPPFKAIIVWKFSRFSRNVEDSVLLKARLRRNGVSILSVSENINESNEYSGLIERIIEWDDAHYLTRLSQEVKRGMLEKASRGEPMSRQFGYDLVNKTLIPNKDAEIVRYIFSSFCNGITLNNITKTLDASGFRTPRGNHPDRRFVEYILHNPVYIGKIRWSQNGKSASRRDYKNENVLIFDGKHEPLIDEDTWNKVQDIFEDRAKKYGKHQRPEQSINRFLKGLLKCSNCGATLIYNRLNDGWQCHNYSRGSCHVSHFLSNGKAETAVIEALKDSVKNVSFHLSPSPAKVSSAVKVDYNKLIAAEKNKLQKLQEAYLSGIDTIDEYKSAKTAVLTKISELEADQTEAMTVKQPDIKAFAKKVTDIISIVENASVSDETKNQALRSVISYITFEKSNKKLNLFFYL